MFDFTASASTATDAAARAAATIVDLFHCPSDSEPATHSITSGAAVYDWAGSNYAINGSSGTGTFQNCDPFGNETDGLWSALSSNRLKHRASAAAPRGAAAARQGMLGASARTRSELPRRPAPPGSLQAQASATRLLPPTPHRFDEALAFRWP